MQISATFIRRPVATTLLAIAVMLAGVLAWLRLPVSSLPRTEFPTIVVNAAMPGANPATMASAIATPLERQFGRIAGVTEMTSASAMGVTNITLQFDLDRNIDGAARDVQAAINATRSQLPANLPEAPSYKKVNPAEPSVLLMVMESDILPLRTLYDLADTIVGQKIAQTSGVGQVSLNGSSKPAVRIEVNPGALNGHATGLEDLRNTLAGVNVNRPKGTLSSGEQSWTVDATDQLTKADQYRPLILHAANGGAMRIGDIASVTDAIEDTHQGGFINAHPAIQIVVNKAPGANVIETVDKVLALLPQL